MKKILVIILVALLALVSFLLFIKVNLDYQQINEMKGDQLEKDKRYLENLSRATETINNLQTDFDLLEVAYKKLELKNTKQTIIEEEFIVTAYTSDECGNLTSTEVDLKSTYAKYLNIAAVDPSVIAYGSILLIKFSNGEIKPYIAMDCGGLIKGKRIDLYFTDVNKALEFGRQKLLVKVIK